MTSRAMVAAVLALAPLTALMFGTGCGDESVTGAGDAKRPKAAVGLTHEECAEAGNRVETLDLNADGKPDIRRVFDKSSGREVCRVSDLNHDGRPDLFEYFDGSGVVRRRELCFDDTGVVNAIEYFEGGRLAKREYDTAGRHKVDTWDFFEPGLPMDAKTGRPVHPSRRERDTKGEGHVDQWWTWEGNKVSIARDTLGTGKPDPSATVILEQGAEGAPSAPPPSAVQPSQPPPPPPRASSGDAGAGVATEGGKP
jgi:hypothetical protein